MSTATDVREAIIARLQLVNGAAPYTMDLSQEGQVKAGRYDVPKGAPFACVYLAAHEEEIGPTTADLTQTATIMIMAWASNCPMDPAKRQLDAEVLAADIRYVLRSSSTLTGTVRKFTTALQIVDAADPQKPDRAVWGAILVAVSATWTERRPGA